MKTKFLTILTLVCMVALKAAGQSFELIGFNPSQTGVVGEDIRTPLLIKNLSNETVYYSVYEVKKQIGSSQTTRICIGDDCFTGKAAVGRENITRMIRKLTPGATDKTFSLVLEGGLVPALSSATYRIVNTKDPADYIQIELQYEVSELQKDGLLYSSINVELSDVYPNPVNETAVFDYKIKNDSKEAKIIIHNVLGVVAGEYKLNPFERQLKISVEHFNPGVYFYSLYIDNEGVATKKLVVRK